MQASAKHGGIFRGKDTGADEWLYGWYVGDDRPAYQDEAYIFPRWDMVGSVAPSAYKVEKQFFDGSYRIVPTNADIGYAITYSTEDAMTLAPDPQSIHLPRLGEGGKKMKPRI